MKKLLFTFLTICMASLALAAPTIDIYFDGAGAIVGDPISNTPAIALQITSTSALTLGRLALHNISENLTFINSGTTYYATYEVTTALPTGIYIITVEAFDSAGDATTKEVTPLYVQDTSAVTVQGFPLNHPNPFDPGVGSTTIAYTLSKGANITLSIFDLSANLIKKTSYMAGLAGGRAGYNEVTWDGKSNAGSFVGNGLYIYLIVADGVVPQNGKGKITVFKQ